MAGHYLNRISNKCAPIIFISNQMARTIYTRSLSAKFMTLEMYIVNNVITNIPLTNNLIAVYGYEILYILIGHGS